MSFKLQCTVTVQHKSISCCILAPSLCTLCRCIPVYPYPHHCRVLLCDTKDIIDYCCIPLFSDEYVANWIILVHVSTKKRWDIPDAAVQAVWMWMCHYVSIKWLVRYNYVWLVAINRTYEIWGDIKKLTIYVDEQLEPEDSKYHCVQGT